MTGYSVTMPLMLQVPSPSLAALFSNLVEAHMPQDQTESETRK